MHQELAALALNRVGEVDHPLDLPGLRSVLKIRILRNVEELQTNRCRTEIKTLGNGVARSADRDHMADWKTRAFRHQQPFGLPPRSDDYFRL